jgi:GT2 family glycosyltransferase
LVTEALASPADIAAWECRQKPYEHPKTYDIVSQETPWSSAACLLLRRVAFAEVDGFDETFFMYGEDVDLSGRLRAAGWKLRYVPSAVVWHYTYGTPGQVKETQYFHGAIGNMYLRLRYGNPLDIVVGIAMQLYLLVHRQRFADKYRKLWQGYRAIFRNARHFLSTRRKRLFAFHRWDYAPQRDGAFVGGDALGTDEPKPTPLVSLIIRTYPGRLPLLQEALQSALLQTYRPLEVIVVEDGGATASDYCTVLSDASDLDVVYYSAPHRGRCFTGNIGLELARGNFIGFLDDDDLLFADHVEVLVDELLKGKARAAYAHAWDIETTFAAGGAWVPYQEKPPQARLAQSFDRARLWRENYIPIQAMLFDRILYQIYGGFAEELENLEDWDLWQRYALEGDFMCVEKTTSIYRTPADPDTRRRRMQKIHDYYPKLSERQARMPFTSTVGELRRITGGDTVFARNRLIEAVVKVPGLYRVGRWVRRLF